MFSKEIETKASKFMSFVLRHQPEALNLKLSSDGWIDVALFIERANQHEDNYVQFTPELIEYVVARNDKQRFALNADKTQIRANQGHTTEIELGLPDVKPPAYLYHGTATRFLDNILKEGLKPMKRHDVHLSFNETIARKVGERHGKAIVLVIDAKKMYDDGFKFQCTANNVWLTQKVPTQYLSQLSSEFKAKK